MRAFFRILCCMGEKMDMEIKPPAIRKDDRTRRYHRNEERNEWCEDFLDGPVIRPVRQTDCLKQEPAPPVAVNPGGLVPEHLLREDRKFADHSKTAKGLLRQIDDSRVMQIEEYQWRERKWREQDPRGEYPLAFKTHAERALERMAENVRFRGVKLEAKNKETEETEQPKVDEEIRRYILENLSSTTDRDFDVEIDRWERQHYQCADENRLNSERLTTQNGVDVPEVRDHGDFWGVVPYHLPRKCWSHTADSGNTVAAEDFNTHARLQEKVRDRFNDMENGITIKHPRDRVDLMLQEHAKSHLFDPSQYHRRQIASWDSGRSDETIEEWKRKRRTRNQHNPSTSANGSNQTVDWERRVRQSMTGDIRGSFALATRDSNPLSHTDIAMSTDIRTVPDMNNILQSYRDDDGDAGISTGIRTVPDADVTQSSYHADFTPESQPVSRNRKGKQRARSSNPDSF